MVKSTAGLPASHYWEQPLLGVNMKRRKSPSKAQNKIATLVDDLAEFEDFRNTILRTIRQDLKDGMTAEELRNKYAALVQARVITEAVSDESGRALTAAKDILDRAHGKATEKKEITHKLQDLSDQELDALIMSEEGDLAEMETVGGEQ